MTFFKYKTANFAKLLAYGFKKSGDGYDYSALILNGEFELRVHVDDGGAVSTKVIDRALNEEYVMHNLDVAGEFVGLVKVRWRRCCSRSATVALTAKFSNILKQRR